MIKEGAFGILPPGNSYVTEGGIRFLRPTEMQSDNQIDWDSCLRAPSEFARHRRARLKKGDVLIAVKGATIASDKSICTVKTLDEPTIVNGSIFRFQTTDETFPDFLLEALSSGFVKKQMKGAMILNNAVDYLSRTIIDNLLIPLPPDEIQKGLIAVMQAARETRQKKLAQADALLAGLDDFILNELGLTLPEKKEVKVFAVKRGALINARTDPYYHHPNFQHIADTISMEPHDTLGKIVRFSNEQWKPDESNQASFRYIEIGGVDLLLGEAKYTEIPVTEAPSRARMVLRNGDIIVSTTRPHRGAIAKIGPELNECIASTGFAVIRDILRGDICREYLWCVLRTQLCLKQMLQRSSGGNYPAITEPELKKILIPTPTESIQNKIVKGCKDKLSEASRLRTEAEMEWTEAKARFEVQLLGK